VNSTVTGSERAAPAAPPLDRCAFVLIDPTHPGNVGACARALRVMGCGDLRIVSSAAPAQLIESSEAIVRASGAADLLRAARQFGKLSEALVDCTLAVAVSASGREFAADPIGPRAMAVRVAAELTVSAEARVAMVFGTERTGLSIADAQRCQLVCSIPTTADYGSLNLAQAVQVISFCLREQLLDTSPVPAGDQQPLFRGYATLDEVERFYGHLEEALIASGFLDRETPRKLMPRLRRLFGRTRLEAEEIDILRGICRVLGRSGQPRS
jgi:tRNA/rRNA methyltransferase